MSDIEQMTDEQAEAAAAAQGWKPKGDDWDDSKGEWRDAREFLKVGEKIDLSKKNKRLEAKLAKLEGAVAKFQPHMEAAIARAEKERDAAIAALEAKREKAVEEGDGKTFTAADKQIKELEAEKRQSEAAVPTPEEVTAAQQAFQARNASWLNRPAMLGAAQAIGATIEQELGTIPPTEFYEEVERRMAEEFPDLFGEKPKKSPVEPSRRNGASKSGRTYSDLPADAKKACDEFVEMGIIASRDDYVKTYDWE